MTDKCVETVLVAGRGNDDIGRSRQPVCMQHVVAVEPDDARYDGDVAGLDRREEADINERDRVVAKDALVESVLRRR